MTERPDLASLAKILTGAMPALDPTQAEICVRTYRLLAHGRPVHIQQIADGLGLRLEEVQSALRHGPVSSLTTTA